MFFYEFYSKQNFMCAMNYQIMALTGPEGPRLLCNSYFVVEPHIDNVLFEIDT